MELMIFMPIVFVQWPVVGRPAWCHILGEKKVSTLSHVLLFVNCNFIFDFSEIPKRRQRRDRYLAAMAKLFKTLEE